MRAGKWQTKRPPRRAGERWRGELLVSEPVGSAAIAARPLFVYLPPSYGAGRGKRRLLLLHDGQNLFDPRLSSAGGWRVPAAVDALDRRTGDAPVVVGIPNAGRRRIWEYTPFRDPRHGGGGAARYLRFLLDEALPRVERSFRIDRRRQRRAIGGASLGAHLSLWASLRSPESFGGLLAMSPTTLFAGEALRRFLLAAQDAPGAHVYLDCGLEEGRRSQRGKGSKRPRAPSAYVRRVRRLRRALERRGFEVERDLRYLEEPNGVHHESAWARRFPAALDWLCRDG